MICPCDIVAKQDLINAYLNPIILMDYSESRLFANIAISILSLTE